MFILRLFILALLLGSLASAQPARETNISTQRGFMSSVWGWITYPFTGWWSSGEDKPIEPIPETPHPEPQPAPIEPPVPDPEPEPENPNAKIDMLYSPGTTAWCNDQTCTTVKCTDPSNCTKITCNIYDTNMNGECVVYNTLAPNIEDNRPSININMTPAHLSPATTLKTNIEIEPVIVTDKVKETGEDVVEKIDLNTEDSDED